MGGKVEGAEVKQLRRMEELGWCTFYSTREPHIHVA